MVEASSSDRALTPFVYQPLSLYNALGARDIYRGGDALYSFRLLAPLKPSGIAEYNLRFFAFEQVAKAPVFPELLDHLRPVLALLRDQQGALAVLQGYGWIDYDNAQARPALPVLHPRVPIEVFGLVGKWNDYELRDYLKPSVRVDDTQQRWLLLMALLGVALLVAVHRGWKKWSRLRRRKTVARHDEYSIRDLALAKKLRHRAVLKSAEKGKKRRYAVSDEERQQLELEMARLQPRKRHSRKRIRHAKSSLEMR